MVPRVGDVQVARCICGDVPRAAEPRLGRRPVVSPEAGRSTAGDGRDHFRHVDPAHSVIAGVGNVESPDRIGRNAPQLVREASCRREAAVSAPVEWLPGPGKRGDRTDDVDPANPVIRQIGDKDVARPRSEVTLRGPSSRASTAAPTSPEPPPSPAPAKVVMTPGCVDASDAPVSEVGYIDAARRVHGHSQRRVEPGRAPRARHPPSSPARRCPRPARSSR